MTNWKNVAVVLLFAGALAALVSWALYGLMDAWAQLARMAVR